MAKAAKQFKQLSERDIVRHANGDTPKKTYKSNKPTRSNKSNGKVDNKSNRKKVVKPVNNKMSEFFLRCKTYGLVFKIFERSEGIAFTPYVRVIVRKVDNVVKYFLVNAHARFDKDTNMENIYTVEIKSFKVYDNNTVKFAFVSDNAFIMTEQLVSLNKMLEVIGKSSLGNFIEQETKEVKDGK